MSLRISCDASDINLATSLTFPMFKRVTLRISSYDRTVPYNSALFRVVAKYVGLFPSVVFGLELPLYNTILIHENKNAFSQSTSYTPLDSSVNMPTSPPQLEA